MQSDSANSPFNAGPCQTLTHESNQPQARLFPWVTFDPHSSSISSISACKTARLLTNALRPQRQRDFDSEISFAHTPIFGLSYTFASDVLPLCVTYLPSIPWTLAGFRYLLGLALRSIRFQTFPAYQQTIRFGQRHACWLHPLLITPRLCATVSLVPRIGSCLIPTGYVIRGNLARGQSRLGSRWSVCPTRLS
jgi:hypothetical protein